jgi:Na+:H+ antiporter, NhaA family
MGLRRATDYVFDNSLLLIAGAAIGLLWANLTPHGYGWLRDLSLLPFQLQHQAEAAGHAVTLQYLVNDVLMAFFFALAGKEVWAAMLPGGALREARRAALPVVCAVGGMAGPALIFVAGAALLGRFNELGRGWAIPCATDIAFSYLIARLVFGKNHPATPFLLLLAIADDAFGLLIIALFYPQKPVEPAWLILSVGAVLASLVMRRLRVKSFWWYLIFPGTLSWAGFALSGIHPALGLLPIIPTLPHARTGEAALRWGTSPRKDALDAFESAWKRPVEAILGLFGLFNAGVALGTFGEVTSLVFVGLLAGKPLGILLSGLIGRRFLGLRMPHGVGARELFVLGCAAGIGFTVALFVATVAFMPGPLQDASRLGALASCLAAVVAFVTAKLLGVRRAE